MDQRQAVAEYVSAFEGWDYLVQHGSTIAKMSREFAAFLLYESAGMAMRFGLALPDTYAALLRDEQICLAALAHCDPAGFTTRIRELLLMEFDGPVTYEEKIRIVEWEDNVSRSVIVRDRIQCALRALLHWGKGSAQERQIRTLCAEYARVDEVLQGGIDQLAFLGLLFEELGKEYPEGALNTINDWWFFEIPAVARGEKQLEDFTYGCTDPIRFPHHRIADYVGDVEEEPDSVIEHLKTCACCRKVVEHATT